MWPVQLLFFAGWTPDFPDEELGSNAPVGKLLLTLQNPAASLRSVRRRPLPDTASQAREQFGQNEFALSEQTMLCQARVTSYPAS